MPVIIFPDSPVNGLRYPDPVIPGVKQYEWNSETSTWELLPQFREIAGTAGQAGATGPIGLNGATGPIGVSGVTGATGIAGASGATGPIGATGPMPTGAITDVLGATAVAGSLTISDDIWFACSDETTNLTDGLKLTFSMPYPMVVSGVFLSCNTAPTGGNIVVDIRESGATIFSTKPRILAGSKTGGSGAVLSDNSLAAFSEITVYLDLVGSTIAGTGLKVWIQGRRT